MLLLLDNIFLPSDIILSNKSFNRLVFLSLSCKRPRPLKNSFCSSCFFVSCSSILFHKYIIEVIVRIPAFSSKISTRYFFSFYHSVVFPFGVILCFHHLNRILRLLQEDIGSLDLSNHLIGLISIFLVNNDKNMIINK